MQENGSEWDDRKKCHQHLGLKNVSSNGMVGREREIANETEEIPCDTFGFVVRNHIKV
jgi:hypothetical protein